MGADETGPAGYQYFCSHKNYSSHLSMLKFLPQSKYKSMKGHFFTDRRISIELPVQADAVPSDAIIFYKVPEEEENYLDK
jgi:hypothetical protein